MFRDTSNTGGVMFCKECVATPCSICMPIGLHRVPQQAQAFTDEAACRQAVSEAQLRFPYQCRQVAGKWEMQLDDGDAPKIVDQVYPSSLHHSAVLPLRFDYHAYVLAMTCMSGRDSRSWLPYPFATEQALVEPI